MHELASGLALVGAPISAAAMAIALLILFGRWGSIDSDMDVRSGLPNGRALKRAGGAGTVIVVARLERFNAISTSLGPELSRRLFVKVAERLTIANPDRRIFHVDDVSLAWFERGGDENSLEDRLEGIERVMRSPVDCGRLVDIKLHFGTAAIEHRDVEQAIADATRAAVYAAGRVMRWHHFNGPADPDSDWQLSLLGELDAAMTSGQLWNAYQPKLDLASGRIVGTEALLRWLHPQRGPIAPGSFLPLLEKHGRARDVALHVLARAIEDMGQWSNSGRAIGVAVNVAPSLLSDTGFLDQVARMLVGGAMPPDRITLELVGSLDVDDAGIEAMKSWRDLGVGLSMGDNDARLSWMGYLHRLPLTELKVDQNLIQGLAGDDQRLKAVQSVVQLAQEFGLDVVAEGIEDAVTLKLLTQMGCNTGQGYYIGRPMSAANFRVFLGGAVQAA